MRHDPVLTRKQIIAAADELFYKGNLRSVSVDEIAAKAGITKKTLYYHFQSKDELIAAYLDARDRPTLTRFQEWAGANGTIAERMVRFFGYLGRATKSSNWRGCGFIRAAAELADMPGHPAMEVARAHKARVEAWLAEGLAAERYRDPASLAKSLMLLVDGTATRIMVHRDTSYAEAAGQMAQMLLRR